MPALRSKPTKFHEAMALYSDPDIYELAAVFSTVAFERGPEHPKFGMDLTYYLCDAEARLYGNRQKAASSNRSPQIWQVKRDLVIAMTGRDLLAGAPPHPDDVRKWRERALPTWVKDEADETVRIRVDDTQEDPVVAAMLAKFTELGVRRARLLGQFAPGVTRDLLNPSSRHAIHMDGTYVEPYSNARLLGGMPDGQPRLFASRAKSSQSARIQTVIHEVKKDDRMAMGVNNVVAATRSKYGRVVVGIERALEWETDAAVDLLNKLVPFVGDGIHTLGYDKAIAGKYTEWLLAKHNILTITRPKARKKNDPETEKADLDAREAIARSLADTAAIDALQALEVEGQGVLFVPAVGQLESTGKTNKKALKPSKAQVRVHRNELLNERYDAPRLIERSAAGEALGVGLELGHSVYINSRRDLVSYRSVHTFFDTHVHLLPDGTACEHDLYVDDTALWEVHQRDGKRIKTARLACTSATTLTVDDSHRLALVHELICPGTGEVIEVVSAFRREHLDRKRVKNRKPRARALAALRPIAPCDPNFTAIYSWRNDIESLFATLKQMFLEGGRAPSLNLNHQLLDMLHAATVENARTLRNFRLEAPRKALRAADQLEVSYTR